MAKVLPRGVLAIDLFGLTADEVQSKYPEVYQWLLERVKPERDQNRDETLRKNWWLHRRQLHDEMDAAVASYGWQADLQDEEILVRLVALNAECSREESQGLVRWLSPGSAMLGYASCHLLLFCPSSPQRVRKFR